MKQTALHQKHLQLKAKMNEFQGWQVAYQYSEVLDEYYATRTAAGLFDIGFLGRIEVSGTGALSFLQKVVTRNVAKIAEGMSSYGLICNDSGYTLNDGLICHLTGNRYMLSTNAINMENVLLWLKNHATADVHITDVTQSTAQLSLQGPLSPRIMESLAGPNFKKMRPKNVREITMADTPIIVSRTGYTGEHGYELFVPSEHAETIWDAVLSAGSTRGILPCGYASRDILRLEMGYFLYGNDINETRTPLEAGLSAVIDFKKDFIGKEALLKVIADGVKEKLVGFELLEKGVPKVGSSVFSENREIGIVTSGGQSPHVRKGIGLGYVVSRYAQPGQEIEIEMKDREIAAKTVMLPFFRKK
jgi:aminomethyltransferase